MHNHGDHHCLPYLQIGLFAKISLQNCPNLAVLLKDGKFLFHHFVTCTLAFKSYSVRDTRAMSPYPRGRVPCTANVSILSGWVAAECTIHRQRKSPTHALRHATTPVIPVVCCVPKGQSSKLTRNIPGDVHACTMAGQGNSDSQHGFVLPCRRLLSCSD